MKNPQKSAAIAGSILAAAMMVGIPTADAAPTKSQAGENSQAGDHMSNTAKEQLRSNGFPGATGDAVDEKGQPPS